MNASVRIDNAKPDEGAEDPTTAVDASTPVERVPASPREIVIYCEGFGAGPGCGWFLELSFLALNTGGFSVFLRCDGTLDDELVDGEPLCEDVFAEDGSWHVEQRSCRIATVEKPLTWRRALRFARGLDSIRLCADDTSDVRVSGVEPWQQEVLTHGLVRSPGVASLARFFSGLPDTDLLELHRRLGGLLSEKASKVLPRLAKALSGTDIRRRTLQQIAAVVGVRDPWNLRALTAAVKAYRANGAED